ncbi:GntR family transcriptional regulator [Pollutimonas bauzanensis]|jgi:GntR family transcriptional regulator|uniref:GntR family transcriptional regulator n=1 Tax=Pollutimonas bauzanensis TaxID=658167 RepID=UPI00333E5592
MRINQKELSPSPIPRYVIVADRLRQSLARGEWRIGENLPSLHQLAQDFGVARLTARQAVQLLVQEGLLYSHRGLGTVVTEAATPIKTTLLETSLHELGQTYRSLVPRILEINETPCPLPGTAKGSTGYVHMRRLHSNNDQPDRPYCVISLYIAEHIFALEPERFRTQAVVPLMLDHNKIQIAQARQTLTIGTADAELATLLHIPVGAPVANVTRVFTDSAGSILYYAEVTYRGDAIRLEIDLKQ